MSQNPLQTSFSADLSLIFSGRASLLYNFLYSDELLSPLKSLSQNQFFTVDRMNSKYADLESPVETFLILCLLSSPACRHIFGNNQRLGFVLRIFKKTNVRNNFMVRFCSEEQV